MVARILCRILGHRWVLQPGITHGDDALYECLRCGTWDWRDRPGSEHEQA